jgi:hypothetical protein
MHTYICTLATYTNTYIQHKHEVTRINNTKLYSQIFQYIKSDLFQWQIVQDFLTVNTLTKAKGNKRVGIVITICATISVWRSYHAITYTALVLVLLFFETPPPPHGLSSPSTVLLSSFHTCIVTNQSRKPALRLPLLTSTQQASVFQDFNLRRGN